MPLERIIAQEGRRITSHKSNRFSCADHHDVARSRSIQIFYFGRTLAQPNKQLLYVREQWTKRRSLLFCVRNISLCLVSSLKSELSLYKAKRKSSRTGRRLLQARARSISSCKPTDISLLRFSKKWMLLRCFCDRDTNPLLMCSSKSIGDYNCSASSFSIRWSCCTKLCAFELGLKAFLAFNPRFKLFDTISPSRLHLGIRKNNEIILIV